MRLRDLTGINSDGVGYVGILTRKSKTDQEVGAPRSLAITNSAPCPVTRMGNWLENTEARRNQTKFPGVEAPELVARLIMRGDAEHGLPSDISDMHSFRPDGPLVCIILGRTFNISGDSEVGNRVHLQFICILEKKRTSLIVLFNEMRMTYILTKSAHWRSSGNRVR